MTEPIADEADLLRRAKAGDQQALADLFACYRGRLRQMVRLRLDRRLYGRLDPSDVLQEAFLDVHYRSRNEALIGFSNEAFYGSRLQPIPGHPRNKAFQAPIRLVRIDGVYRDRSNEAEAKAAANLVADLLYGWLDPRVRRGG